MYLGYAASEKPGLYDETRNFPAQLISNTRITQSDHTQDVRHIALSIAGSGINYAPGDVLYVRPRNSPERVAFLLDWLGAESEQHINCTQATPAFPGPACLNGAISV